MTRQERKTLTDMLESFKHDKRFYAAHAKKKSYDRVTKERLDAKSQVSQEIMSSLFWFLASGTFSSAHHLGWEGHRVNTLPLKHRNKLKEFAGFRKPKRKLSKEDKKIAFYLDAITTK